MKVSGFTFLRNGQKLGYPFVESIRSLLPLVDEFIIALGPCDDQTDPMLRAIGDPKIRIIPTQWNEKIQSDYSVKGFVYGQQKSIALFNCTGDWAFYLEADEVVHEDDLPKIRAAMERHLTALPAGRTRFVLQWLEDFPLASGGTARLPAGLRSHSRVEIVSRFFADGEYAQRLAATQVLLLPYRCSSYALRVSRVVIEALVNGLPVVATRGTTLADQAEQFGAAVLCDDGGVESLMAAIETVERDYPALATRAGERRTAAREHFSVRHFRSLLAAATRAEI